MRVAVTRLVGPDRDRRSAAALEAERSRAVASFAGRRSRRRRGPVGHRRPHGRRARACRTSARSSNLAGENIGQRWTSTTRRRAWESRVDGTRLLAETAARLPGRPALVLRIGGRVLRLRERRAPRRDLAAGLGLPRRARRGVGGCGRAGATRRAPHRPPAAGARPLASRRRARARCCFPSSSAAADGSGAAASGGAGSRSPTPSPPTCSRSSIRSRGPFNVAAPGAVTNEEFTKELGKALHRPTLLPAPTFALKTIFGEMADEMLLGGQRVSLGEARGGRLHVRLPGPARGPRGGARRVGSPRDGRARRHRRRRRRSRPRLRANACPGRSPRRRPAVGAAGDGGGSGRRGPTAVRRRRQPRRQPYWRASPTKEVDSMSAIASSAPRVARSVG